MARRAAFNRRKEVGRKRRNKSNQETCRSIIYIYQAGMWRTVLGSNELKDQVVPRVSSRKQEAY